MTEESRSPVTKQGAASERLMPINLFPYPDGRAVYFPLGRLGKGYIFEPEEAEIILGQVGRRRTSSSGMFLIAAILAVVIAMRFGGWLADAIISVGVASILLVFPFFRWLEYRKEKRKLSGMFGQLTECRHPYPFDYVRLWSIAERSVATWMLVLLYFLWFIVVSGMTVVLLIDQLSTSVSWSVLFPMAVLSLACLTAHVSFRRRLRFRRLNGRAAQASDLLPIDPLTGQMPYRPFVEPVPGS